MSILGKDDATLTNSTYRFTYTIITSANIWVGQVMTIISYSGIVHDYWTRFDEPPPDNFIIGSF